MLYEQSKLEVVKQETARMNNDILGINELKWTGMGAFNSDDHYIYYCGQESLRRNGVAIIVNKRVQNVVLGCNLKNDRIISIHFRGKPFDITVIQVYSPTSSAEEAEVDLCSLEGLMLKLKLQYFGHLMRRAGSLEKILMLGKTEGRRRRG